MTIGWRSAALPSARTDAETPHAPDAVAGSTTVTVTLIGALRRLAGRREVVVELPQGTTLRTLLGTVAERCDPAFGREVLTGEGDLQSHVAVFIDGMQVPSPSGLRTQLSGGRVELMLVTMYEGG